MSAEQPGARRQDRKEAEAYIAALAGAVDAPVTFQTFCEDDSGRRAPTILHGTLAQHWGQLVSLNDHGHGVFMMVNKGDLLGRRAQNVIAPRALFIDDDGKGAPVVFGGPGAAPFLGPLPSLTVQSKAGQHNYFVLEANQALDAFSPAQKTLALYFGTDTAVHDLPRVMRVPGFFHLKDPRAPHLVRVVHASMARYGIDEVVAAYSPAIPSASSSPKVASTPDQNQLREARAYVAKVPPAIQGEGGDNATYTLCCCLVCGFGLTNEEALEVLLEWNAGCQPPWAEAALVAKLDNARRYGTEEIGGRLKNTSSTASPTDSLAFLVPQERYVYRRPDGTWNLSSSIGEAGAKGHLISMGCRPKDAGQVIAQRSCVIAHGIECRPGAEPVFLEGEWKYLNSYVPPKIIPQAFPWPTIETLLSTVTSGDKNGIEWVFNWMAYKVQNPGSRSMTALVLQGLHGTGKSLLGVIFSRILGEENTVTIGQRDLENTFNEPYASKLLVLADEVVNRDNLVETSSKLKQMITDPKILVNAKHQRQVQVENRMTWFFTSNNPTPVKVEGRTDRRYTVFSIPTPPPDDYKRVLGSLFDATGQPTREFIQEMQGFAFALTQHEVDRAMAKQPYTNAAREDLADASRSASEMFFEEVLERGIVEVVTEYMFPQADRSSWDFAEKGVAATAVYQAYRGFCSQGGYTPMTRSNFGKDLHQRHPQWRRVRFATALRPWVYVGMPRSGVPEPSDAPREAS